ncbi:hypothetical protein [Parapedobacter tibetensis]|uniref:hypothetical protein n=1 Tax=Parapedobacter tibetensis TaxID=2972951 RepID=UPI00214DE2F0|nr:hypothetical protein [Parapedobacter tibetensis]
MQYDSSQRIPMSAQVTPLLGLSSGAGVMPFFQPRLLTPATGIQRNPQPRTTTSSSPTHQRQPNPLFRSIPEGIISRVEFDQYLMGYFGVQDVHTGTQTEQEEALTRHGGSTTSIPNWQSWDPGASSADYSHIIRAIEDVAETFGTIPTIRTVVFFKISYKPNATGMGVAEPGVGASFGAGRLTIYEAFSRSRAFPNARSDASGTYPAVGVVLAPATGETPGAPRPYQSREYSLRENIVHELGHGIAEDALRADPDVFTKFHRAVGWVGGQLFDIGQPAVANAILTDTLPPSQYQIQANDWNNPQWIEQPMSYYAVDDGPGEDFAEAISAFVYAPSILQQRTPNRHQFILDNIGLWTTRMRSLPQPLQRGDFPLNEEIGRMA